MTTLIKGRFLAALVAASPLALAGCGPFILVGAATEGVRTVAQERSTMDAFSDAEIQLSLNNRFVNHSTGLFLRVSTDVQEGRVVLLGNVPNAEDKVAAQRIAWETPGVVSVTDELKVADGGGVSTYANDAWISTQLRTRLFSDFEIASQNYNVETISRVVHITGLARSPQELARVVAHAQSVDGVTEIVSHVLTIDDPRRVGAAGAGG